MLFWLSCLLKSCLSFLTLVVFLTDNQIDSILVIFLSLQIIVLDYLVYVNNEKPNLDFLYFKNLNYLTLKRNFALVSTAFMFIGSMCFFVSPLYSYENICIPDLKNLKQHTADTNYMSFEGYIISHFKVNYDKDISRGEAQKIVKDYFRNQSRISTVDNNEVISKINSNKVDVSPKAEEKLRFTVEKCRNTLDSLKKITAVENQSNITPSLAVEKEIPSKVDKINNTISNIEVKKELTVNIKSDSKSDVKLIEVVGRNSQYNSKRIVLLPYKIASGGFEALDSVSYFTHKYLREKGYEVISGADVEGVCFNLDNLNKAKINEIAEKFDANYIITGEVLKYNRYKKVQTAGILLDAVLFGIHNYGEVEVNTKIFNASKQKCYSHTEKMTRKHQVLAAFNGTSGVMSYAVKAVVDQLFSKFIL